MKRIKTAYLLFFLSTGFLLAGCAAVEEATMQEDLSAKQLTPPAGQSLIYVLRTSSLGYAVGFDVSIDGQYVGTTGGSTYIFSIVSPGKHTLISSAENDAVLPLEVAADSVYYVRQEVSMGIWKARNSLQWLPSALGRHDLMGCRLSSKCVEIQKLK
jgi:hypothetical protein